MENKNKKNFEKPILSQVIAEVYFLSITKFWLQGSHIISTLMYKKCL